MRPGLIVGANDPTGRFTYWPHRVARGGRVARAGAAGSDRCSSSTRRTSAPGSSTSPSAGRGGIYNATHPGRSLREVLEICREVSGSDATFEWVPAELLNEHEVGEWMELPLWISDPDSVAMHEVDVSRAVAAGLTFRPLEETVRDTLEHAATVEGVGLTPEREAELLSRYELVGLRGPRSQRGSSRRILSGSTPRASARSSVSSWKRTMSATGCTVGTSVVSQPSSASAAAAPAARSAARPSPSSTKARTDSSTAAR